MAADKPPLQSEAYLALPGRGQAPGFFSVNAGVQQLWLGADHLLLVTTRSFVEEYHRFYFGDIRAIFLSPAPRPWIYQILLSLICVPFVVWAYYDPELSLRILGGCALAQLLALALNMGLGPGCRCVLVSKVSQENLGSLRRIRTALKALALLEPKIREAQSLLPVSAEAVLLDAPVPHPQTRPLAALSPQWHRLAFGVMAVSALASLGHIFIVNTAYFALETLLTLLSWLTLIGAAITQQGGAFERRVKLLIWWSLGAAALEYIVGIGWSAAMAAKNVGQYPDALAQWLNQAQRPVLGDPVLLFLCLLRVSVGLLASLLGFISLAGASRREPRP
jgi:hypothetical protein